MQQGLVVLLIPLIYGCRTTAQKYFQLATKMVIAKLLFTLFISHGAIAGELKASPLYKPNGEVSGHNYVYSGEIKAGDAERFASFIIANKDSIDTVNLNSLGGNVQEAITMGELIKAARLDTWVQPGSTCASACFFMWINGANRNALLNQSVKNNKTGQYVSSKIGLHRPYMRMMDNDEKSLSNQTKLIKGVDAYLTSKGIPRRLIDLMMSRASNDIYWMTGEDYDEIGQSPIDLEELYISKCNDNRKKLYTQISISKSNNNTELTDLLYASVGAINDCIDKLNGEARRKFIDEKFSSILKKR
jgi:hypothetical protein